MSIHCHHIGLQNSCHVRDICHVRDNITFNVSSILQMHDSKFLLYLKSTACQYLLSNKKSVFKVHPYKTWLLIKYCHVWDVLEWQFPFTMSVHFHALWIHCTVKTNFSKKLHTLRYISIWKTLEDWGNPVLVRVLTNNIIYRTWKLDHTLKDRPLTNWCGASSQWSISQKYDPYIHNFLE